MAASSLMSPPPSILPNSPHTGKRARPTTMPPRLRRIPVPPLADPVDDEAGGGGRGGEALKMRQ